ncbi:SDR family oxidoreductase [Nocardioides rubriscoriae]|uniref:SDR family oxidoreductase n=1 Tax=Nocardioides rubriscoriae TaxID=642762 RepID=UPI0011DFAF43|nr:SDR family NAD(P)-dependent oxidoreductase [Nocardioides rubriscoriae]
MNGLVVLITGATSGIGLGLALRMAARGDQVIISGRDPEKVKHVTEAHPQLAGIVIDVRDLASIRNGLAEVAERHDGRLDMLVNNAGIQRRLNFTNEQLPDLDLVADEVATNLTGFIGVTTTALPLLRTAPSATVVHIGSGLGLVPLVAAPVYSATKAAVHSFTISLRAQLADSNVSVVEVIPPAVVTELHRDQPSPPPRVMALDDFLDATMKGLDAGRPEVYVGLTKALRIGARISPRRFLSIVNKP